MLKIVLPFLQFSFILLALTQLPALAQTTDKPGTTTAVDDEYVQHRQKADDFFKLGRYEEARRQYRNCLLVPKFENDTYAKQRIDLATKCLELLQRADESMQQQKNSQMVDALNQLLAVNPVDPLANGRLADYYLLEGNESLTKKRYSEARDQYNKGLVFAKAEGNRAKQSTLEQQIRNTTVTFVTPKRAGLKVGMAALALGSGFYAYTLQNDFTTKKNAFDAIAQSTDPDGDGIINTPDEYQRHNKAYTDAENAQSKRGLSTACMAVAAAATITELYLLIHKAKPRQVVGFHWKPSSAGYGLAVGYRF